MLLAVIHTHTVFSIKIFSKGRILLLTRETNCAGYCGAGTIETFFTSTLPVCGGFAGRVLLQVSYKDVKITKVPLDGTKLHCMEKQKLGGQLYVCVSLCV